MFQNIARFFPDFWVEIVAVVLPVTAALGCVFWQIRAQRQLTKQNNSINIALLLYKDRDLLHALGVVGNIHDSGEKAEKYANSGGERKSNEWVEKSRALFTLVNYFETFCVGIDSDIYDWEIIYKCDRGMFMTIYERTQEFINVIRSEFSNDFGKHFEHVVKEFSKSDLKKYTPLQ